MSSDNRRSVIDHARSERERRDRYDRADRIKDCIERCSGALERAETAPDRATTREYYHYIAERLRDDLVPLLAEHTDRGFGDYDRLLAGHDSWDWVALASFLEAPESVVNRLNGGGRSAAAAKRARGFPDEDTTARLTVTKALGSLTAIAEHESLVLPEYTSSVDVEGFALKIGEHLQDEKMDLGEPLSGVTEQAGTLKTLFTGGTGMAKSTGLEVEAEDYYQQNFCAGPDYKLVDIVGMRDGENWFYDIPQQQEVLRDARKGMDLPADFTETSDLEEPSIEILAPLTPGLSQQELPFDTDAGEFTVQPFTVPAADLSKPLLVSLIMSRVSQQEENTIRQAYDDVDAEHDDWALKDLADAIKHREELNAKHKQNAIGVLRSLQSVGFIRTRESEYTLDWRDVFTDVETITVFTQAFCESDISRLMTVAYLVDAIVDEREQMYGIPECVILMRELWKVVPHSKRQVDDSRGASIQESIGTRLTKVMRENRHYGLHVLGDTQWPSDLLISVRGMFNRYVVYGAHKDMAQQVFEWTQNDKWRSFWATMTPKRGQAGIVGQLEPAVKHRDIEFLSPVNYAAPSHHHRDRLVDDNGWRARCEYLDREELRRPIDVGVDWPDELPGELEVGAATSATGDTGPPDPAIKPIAAFAHECLEVTDRRDVYVYTEDVRTAYEAWAEEHDAEPIKSAKSFGIRLKRAIGDVDNHQRDGTQAYITLRFTEAGERYFQENWDAEYAAHP